MQSTQLYKGHQKLSIMFRLPIALLDLDLLLYVLGIVEINILNELSVLILCIYIYLIIAYFYLESFYLDGDNSFLK